jgi:thiamine phosphate synthase YjbQ (UPF0047 family)
MILVNRHTDAGGGPFHATLRIRPASRVDLIDVRGTLREEYGSDFTRYPKAFYISDHTTAGYLDRHLAEVLEHDGDNIQDYLQVFQKLFPPDAGYVHDELHLRTELSAEQRATEPRNADSHLTFIGGGLRNCASYELPGKEPVWFVELDGIHAGGTRQRRTTVIAYRDEEDVARMQVPVTASPHSIDAQNLRDPRLGFVGQLQALAREHRVSFGRFDISLPAEELHAGLTVNEYETLLMRHDLAEVLRDPLRFMAENSRDLLSDPRSIPNKTINYAKYDLVQVFNELVDVLHLSNSVVERILSRFFVAPARRFLQVKRSVSLPVSDRETPGTGRLAQGRYQSPILMQWRRNEPRTRVIDVTLTRFR